VTLFVSGSNYLMAIIGLVDRKWLLLKRLYGRKILENHECKELIFRKEGEDFTTHVQSKTPLRVNNYRWKEAQKGLVRQLKGNISSSQIISQLQKFHNEVTQSTLLRPPMVKLI
jgi:hypothetical protein